MHQIQQAAIKSLLYSDLFDYPLTAEEMWQYAPVKTPCSLNKMLESCVHLSPMISSKTGYYFLSGREHILNIRLSREKINEKKIQHAQYIASFLAKIPTILFIGISGSVAMKNADIDEDIDLFFITQQNSVWISRFLVVLLLELLQVRRRKHATNVQDKICANMFISQDTMEFPQNRQNIYLAHEILQIIPLFSRENIHEKFLKANKWIYHIFPNWKRNSFHDTKYSIMRTILGVGCMKLEPLVRWLQVNYMKKDRTIETISKQKIAFHPRDMQTIILKQFAERCKKYDL